jgi:hypothetical protein
MSWPTPRLIIPTYSTRSITKGFRIEKAHEFDENSSHMRLILTTRLLATMMVVPVTYLFAYWSSFSLGSSALGEQSERIANLAALFCAVGAGWLVWTTS